MFGSRGGPVVALLDIEGTRDAPRGLEIEDWDTPADCGVGQN
jgi:hypothetical protein